MEPLVIEMEKPDRSEDWLLAGDAAIDPEIRRQRYTTHFNVGSFFQENTKYMFNLRTVQSPHNNYVSLPIDRYKDNPSIPLTPLAELPPLETPLGELLLKRRSSLNFRGKTLPFATFDKYLQYAAGGHYLRQRRGEESVQVFRKTYPSGGAHYPIQNYLWVENVADIERGLYFHHAPDNCLRKIEHDASLLDQIIFPPDTDAAFIVFMTQINSYMFSKYGARAFRLSHLEAGHAGENFSLMATAFGLPHSPLMAWFDDTMNQFIGIDGHYESFCYKISVSG